MQRRRSPRRRRWLARRPSGRVLRLAALVVVLAVLATPVVSALGRHGGPAGAWLALTARAGFTVEEVLVEGRLHVGAADLLRALAVGRGDPLFAVEPDAVRRELEALAWVRSARVERRLPDTVVLHIEERRPIALWQHDYRQRLIDAEGVVLAEHGLGRFADLPYVLGADAAAEAAGFLALLAAAPEVAHRVTLAERVGQRRWDLLLDNGMRVRLPEEEVATALARLADLQAHQQIFERDVLTIDLRLDDRLFIRAHPAALERRHLPEEST